MACVTYNCLNCKWDYYDRGACPKCGSTQCVQFFDEYTDDEDDDEGEGDDEDEEDESTLGALRSTIYKGIKQRTAQNARY